MLRKGLIFFLCWKKRGLKCIENFRKMTERLFLVKDRLWLVPSLQTLWFWCWRQFKGQKARELRIRWIGGIAWKGLVQNAKKLSTALAFKLQAIWKRLNLFGMIREHWIWVSYDLERRNVERHLLDCEQQVQRQKWMEFHHHIALHDANWTYYCN